MNPQTWYNYGRKTGFSPLDLFKNNEQGVWYDPSDFARYMATGSELVPTIDFTLALWGKSNIVSQTTNTYTTGGFTGGVALDIFTIGRTYTVTVNGSITGGGFSINTSDALVNPTARTELLSGFGTVTFVANNRFLYLRNSNSSTTTTVTAISVKELTAISTCTLFQDSIGTTPVTAVGQPVGLMLDKSKNLTLGVERITNGTFDTDIAGWTASAGATISWSSGKLRMTKATTDQFPRATTTITGLTIGRSYRVSTDFVNPFGREVYIATTTGSNANRTFATSRNIGFIFTATATTMSIDIGFWGATGNVGDYSEFDNISVREIAGTHAIQSTAINRPTLQIDLNGNYYLSANGTNSTMSTATNLNMTASDKVMVLAGVRKNTSTDGMIAELSATQVTNVATFQLRSSLSGNPTYYFSSRGTSVQAIITSSNYGAGATDVLCGQGDISAPLVNLRVNSGAEELTNVTTQGLGNYGSYPLFLFARAGTNVFFNGRLYGIIVRGTATTDRDRAKAEKFMTNKTLLATAPVLDGIASSNAFSLRRLYSNYTGPCLRVRNSSTNVETDIGFAENGWIDQTALLAATGANSGFVVTWYDQSGGGRNATQTTAATQPRIVLNGVVHIENGRPCIMTASSTNGLSVNPAGLFRNVAGASISSVFRLQAGAMQNNVSLFFASTGPNATSTRLAFMLTPNGSSNVGIGVRRLDTDSYVARASIVPSASLVGNTAISTIVMDYENNLANQWINRNNVILNEAVQTTGLTSDTDPLSAVIFSRGSTSVPLNTSASEVIYFNQALTTEQRTSIENNQSTAFNII